MNNDPALLHELLYTWHAINVIEDKLNPSVCHVTILWNNGSEAWSLRFLPSPHAQAYVDLTMLAFALAQHLRKLPSA